MPFRLKVENLPKSKMAEAAILNSEKMLKVAQVATQLILLY
jgi:hypothetical protein